MASIRLSLYHSRFRTPETVLRYLVPKISFPLPGCPAKTCTRTRRCSRKCCTDTSYFCRLLETHRLLPTTLEGFASPTETALLPFNTHWTSQLYCVELSLLLSWRKLYLGFLSPQLSASLKAWRSWTFWLKSSSFSSTAFAAFTCSLSSFRISSMLTLTVL